MIKLNLNPKELLALHNLLRQSVTAELDMSTSDINQLYQVYNRIRTYIVNSLSESKDNKSFNDLFVAWSSKEQTKIDKLNNELDELKKQSSPKKPTTSASNFITLDDDYDTSDYPKKGTKNPGHRQGKHNNKR